MDFFKKKNFYNVTETFMTYAPIISIKTDCDFICVFSIYNVQPEDEGRYICTAQSEYGSARDYVWIRVEESEYAWCIFATF